MSAPSTGAPELWVDWETVKAVGCTATLPGSDDSRALVQSMILTFVSNVLWERSCRQFGIRTFTARPLLCCSCHHHRRCASGQFDVIDLGDTPVKAVTQVKVDGLVLAGSTYRVDDWRWLVRTDGELWPWANDLSVLDGDQTFLVTWQAGLEVPLDGKLAAAALACKYASQIAASCAATPENATSKSMEGVTIQLAPPKPGESFGVALVDDWLSRFPCGNGGVGSAIYNPGRHDRLARVNT